MVPCVGLQYLLYGLNRQLDQFVLKLLALDCYKLFILPCLTSDYFVL